MQIAYLGLGSNLGDRAANLAQARTLLKNEWLFVRRASSLYETAPRDVLDQPHFLNQVLEVATGLFPRQLLERAQRIEREMGRVKLRDKGPRLIDIDVLFHGNTVMRTRELVIPHPALTERRFVLEPLVELAPDLHHPVLHRTLRALLAEVADQDVKRLSSDA